MTEFLSIAQVAERLGLSTKAVRRAIERGELRAAKICGRIRIRREDVDAWVEESVIRPDERAPLHRPIKLPAAHGLRSLLHDDETREGLR